MFILGDPVKNDDEIDTILSTLKNDLLNNEDLSFSDEESETSPKKSITFENNISPIKTSPGMILFTNEVYRYIYMNIHLKV